MFDDAALELIDAAVEAELSLGYPSDEELMAEIDALNEGGDFMVAKDSEASRKAWLSRKRGALIGGETPALAPDLASSPDMEGLKEHLEKMLAKQKASDIVAIGLRADDAHGLLNVIKGEMGVAKRRGRAVKFVVQDGKVLSGIEYRKTGENIYIDYLGSLAPGQGAAWMHQVEAEAKQQGKGVRLTALPAAVPFYEKLGYVPHPSGKSGDMYKPASKIHVLKDDSMEDVGALVCTQGEADEIMRPDGLSHVFKDSEASKKAWLKRQRAKDFVKFEKTGDIVTSLAQHNKLGIQYFTQRALHGKMSPQAQEAYKEWKKSDSYLMDEYKMANNGISAMNAELKKKWHMPEEDAKHSGNITMTPAAPKSIAANPLSTVPLNKLLTAGQKAAQTKKLKQQLLAAQKATLDKQKALDDLTQKNVEAGESGFGWNAVSDAMNHAKKLGATDAEVNAAILKGDQIFAGKKTPPVQSAAPKKAPPPKAQLTVKDQLMAAHLEVMTTKTDHEKHANAKSKLYAAITAAENSGLTKGQLAAMKAHATMAYKAMQEGETVSLESKTSLKVPMKPAKEGDYQWIGGHLEIRQKAYEHASKVWHSMTPQQQQALKDYTGSSYQEANKKQAEANGEYHGAYAKLLHEALGKPLGVPMKLRRNTAQKHFWSGLGLDVDNMDYDEETLGKLIGKTYRAPVFSSTSHDKNMSLCLSSTAQKSGGVKLIINAPAHAKGFLVENYSNHQSEKEVILQRGSVFLIRKITKLPTNQYSSGVKYHYEVEVDLMGSHE